MWFLFHHEFNKPKRGKISTALKQIIFRIEFTYTFYIDVTKLNTES